MDRFFNRLGMLIVNKRLAIIIIVILLVIASLLGAMRINMATGLETMVSTDSDVYQNYDKFNQYFSTDVIAVLLVGDDINQLLEVGNVQAMESVENQMAANPNVLSVLGPAFFIKAAATEMTGSMALPDDPTILKAIVLEPISGQIRPQFDSIFPNNTHALIAISLKGGLSWDESKEMVEVSQQTVAEAGFTGITSIVTGEVVFDSQLDDLIAKSLRNMFIVAIVLMLLILALIFNIRGVFAWRWLPLGMVFIGIIYTFGAMGFLSIPLAMATMAVFPILIGLGIDYAIQFHSRYDEENRKGETTDASIVTSITHVGPATGIALVASCLGFTGLLFSPVPMVQDFGYMLIIGVISCYLVATFLLLPILHRRGNRPTKKITLDSGKEKSSSENIGLLERGLRRLAPWVIKNPAIIIPVALALTVGGFVADFHVETETEMINSLSKDLPIVRDFRYLESVTGGLNSSNLLIEAEDITKTEILDWMVQLEKRIAEDQPRTVTNTSSIAGLVLQATDGKVPQNSHQIREILDAVPIPVKSNLVNEDYTAANIIVSIGEIETDRIINLNTRLAEYTSHPPVGVNVAVTGWSVTEIETFNSLSSGRVKVTLISVGLVFVALFLLLRFSILRAFMSTLSIGLIICWSSGLMYLLGMKFTFVSMTLGALIIGIGIEYSILLMKRYFEERNRGSQAITAMTIAMTSIGRAIIASALTTIGGFGALLAAGDFPVLQNFGSLIMIDVFLALVSTLFVLPALIVWVDSWKERRRLAMKANKG